MEAPKKIYISPLMISSAEILKERVTDDDVEYIRKDLIKAEIERRIDNIKPKPGQGFILREQITRQLQDLLSFLSTLESEKPIIPDLEKELTRFYLKDLCGSEKDEIPEATLHHNFPIMWDDLRDIARHFAQWGANHTPLPEDTVLFNKGVAEGKRLVMEEWLKDRDGCFWDGVEEGKKAMKEQMMKEAVEGYVTLTLTGVRTVAATIKEEDNIGPGDKVRIIIVKEDEI